MKKYMRNKLAHQSNAKVPTPQQCTGIKCSGPVLSWSKSINHALLNLLTHWLSALKNFWAQDSFQAVFVQLLISMSKCAKVELYSKFLDKFTAVHCKLTALHGVNYIALTQERLPFKFYNNLVECKHQGLHFQS